MNIIHNKIILLDDIKNINNNCELLNNLLINSIKSDIFNKIILNNFLKNS